MSRRVWPLSLAAREGIATARAGRWTSLLIIITVAWSAAAGAADAVDVTRLVQNERAWIDAGGHVLMVTGAKLDGLQNPIPADVCDRLVELDGISGSFAVASSGAIGSLSYIPGGRVSIYSVSAGASTFLGAPPATNGIVIATLGFAQRAGVQDGDVVWVAQQGSSHTPAAASDPLTLRVVDTAVVGEGYDGALLMPERLTDTADTCYVRTDAAHYEAVNSALPSVLAYNGMPAIPTPRLFESEFTVDYTSAYEDRQLRWLWVPTAALLGLLWAMLQWFRRSHVAIYATFGMRAPARLVMQFSEWGALAGLGLLWGWALGVVGALAFGARVEQALAQVTPHALLTVLGASVVVAHLAMRPTGTLLNALKDH